jgi:hypothetical protein
LIERIHFNSEFPENHNILISNFRSNYAKVFDGKLWKTMDEDQLITWLINTYEHLLEDWAEGNPARMKYIEKYKDIFDRDGHAKVYRDLRGEIKKMIYDRRGMVKCVNKIKN